MDTNHNYALYFSKRIVAICICFFCSAGWHVDSGGHFVRCRRQARLCHHPLAPHQWRHFPSSIRLLRSNERGAQFAKTEWFWWLQGSFDTADSHIHDFFSASKWLIHEIEWVCCSGFEGDARPRSSLQVRPLRKGERLHGVRLTSSHSRLARQRHRFEHQLLPLSPRSRPQVPRTFTKV